MNMGYKHDLIHLKEFVFWRLTFRISTTKLVNTTQCKWWSSCIGIRHTSNLFFILV